MILPPSERDFNPSSRFSWLATPAPKNKFRWLFTPRQTKRIIGVLVGLGLIVALMIWPILSVNSLAWPIYWIHDHLFSPLIGRIFLRYSPYPEIIIAIILLLALFALYARTYSGDLHRNATYRALSLGWFGRILLGWANWRKEDSFLLALSERRFREAFQVWLGSRSAVDFESALKTGILAQKLVAAASSDGVRSADLALAGITARLIILQRLNGKLWPAKSDPIMISVSSSGKDICKSLHSLFGTSAKVTKGEEVILSLWKRGEMWPHADQTEYWETICWLALVHSFQHADSYLARHCLLKLAEYGFVADTSWTADHHRQARFEVDTALWECLEAEIHDLGSGPGMAAISNIRDNITWEVKA